MPRTLVSVKMDSNRVSQEPNSSERLPAGKKKKRKNEKKSLLSKLGHTFQSQKPSQ